MKLNWTGSKHAWSRGTTTAVAQPLGSRAGRHRAGGGLAKCMYHSGRNARVVSSNGISLCSTCERDLT